MLVHILSKPRRVTKVIETNESVRCEKTMNEKKQPRYRKPKMEHWQVINVGLFLYDILAVNVAFFLALWLRFDCQYSEIPVEYLKPYMMYIPLNTLVCVLVFWRARLYKSIWRFASYSELLRVGSATAISASIHIIGITVIFERMPMSYYVFGTVLQFFAVLGIRFSYRLILKLRTIQEKRFAEEL